MYGISPMIQALIVFGQGVALFCVSYAVRRKYLYGASSTWNVLSFGVYQIAAFSTWAGLLVPFTLLVLAERVVTYVLRWVITEGRVINAEALVAALNVPASKWRETRRRLVETERFAPGGKRPFGWKWSLIRWEGVNLLLQLLTYPIFVRIWASP